MNMSKVFTITVHCQSTSTRPKKKKSRQDKTVLTKSPSGMTDPSQTLRYWHAAETYEGSCSNFMLRSEHTMMMMMMMLATFVNLNGRINNLRPFLNILKFIINFYVSVKHSLCVNYCICVSICVDYYVSTVQYICVWIPVRRSCFASLNYYLSYSVFVFLGSWQCLSDCVYRCATGWLCMCALAISSRSLSVNIFALLFDVCVRFYLNMWAHFLLTVGTTKTCCFSLQVSDFPHLQNEARKN